MRTQLKLVAAFAALIFACVVLLSATGFNPKKADSCQGSTYE